MHANGRFLGMGLGAAGPCLPAPVDPEPVVGMLPDLLLYSPCDLLREIDYRGVAGQGGGEWAPDADQLPAVRLPDGEGRDQRSPAPEREHRRGGRGGGLLALEFAEKNPVAGPVPGTRNGAI